ncbi:MAG: hypothetical protein IPL26_13750 [Leptospiraceae bacterium]|nr:hypothetical protein [Leptospiraceae bacterium]
MNKKLIKYLRKQNGFGKMTHTDEDVMNDAYLIADYMQNRMKLQNANYSKVESLPTGFYLRR